MNANRTRKLLRLILLFGCALSLAPLHSLAQSADDYDDKPPKPYVNLSITIKADDQVDVTVSANLPKNRGSALLPEVEASLGCKLTPEKVSDGELYWFRGRCRLNIAKSGLIHTKTLSLVKLTEAAKNLGAESLSLQIFLPDTDASQTLPPAPSFFNPALASRMPSRALRGLAHNALYLWTDWNAVPSSIRIQYGYTQATIAKTAAILLFVFLFPLMLVSWLGRRALKAPQEQAPSVWFSYMRYLSWTLNLALISWFATLETLDFHQIWRFVFSGRLSQDGLLLGAAYDAVLWVMPAVVWIAGIVLSKPVQEKLRKISWTRRELVLQAVFTFCSSFLPIALWLNALFLFTTGRYRAAVLLFFTAIAVLLFAKGKLAKLLRMQPQAITSGDLRDVAFAVAGRLGVPLQQIFLIPSGKGRMANAFARTGNTIAFTDYLLLRMTKREVNFVIAHELTHLQKKHPGKILGIGVAVAAGIATVFGAFSGFFRVPPVVFYAFVVAVSTLVTYACTRHFEYEADAGAVAATQDPPAALCALFKLAELNLHPLQWSSWAEKWVTHPSMMRRAKAIAKAAGIPEVSIHEIVARGLEPAVHYTVPDASQSKQKVMSTTSKARNLRWAVFALLAAALLPPAVFAFAAQSWPALGAHRYALYGAGFAVAVGLHFFFTNYLSVWRLSPLVKKMEEKVEAEGGVQTQAWGGIPVALAPDDRPRVYEGLTHWDLGFLFVRSDRICYLGEETSFSLRHDQVTDLRLGPGNPSWLLSGRIYIAWKDSERQTSGVFSIASAHPQSARKLYARTTEVFRQLNQWKSARAASRPLPDRLATLESPQLRQVTSQSPASIRKGNKLFAELFLTSIMAMMVALLFGLPFHLMAYLTRYGQTIFSGAGAGWYVVTAAVAIRVFQIAPVFSFKDSAVLVPPVVNSNTPQSQVQTPKPAVAQDKGIPVLTDKR